MFKSIFSKLIAMFIVILLIGYSVTSVLLYIFLGKLASKEKAESLNKAGDAIQYFLKLYLDNRGSALANLFLTSSIEQYSSTAELILVTLSDGTVALRSPNIRLEVMDKLVDGSGILRLPDLKQHDKLIASQQSDVEIGDFYGLFKDTGMLWLAVEKPYSYKVDYYPYKYTGVVYLFTPIPEVQDARKSVFKFFLISVGVAILISFILVYIFSLRISKPLKQIKNAAKIIAGGEFSKRLTIKSEDEIGELAKSFNQMVTALQNLEEMRRGFIANVSHELRTPMTSIRGFVEGILDGTIPPERQNVYLSIVRDETDRLNRLVNNLLDLARIESGEMKLNFKVFDISELVRKCIIKLENFITSKNIQVEAYFEEEEQLVYADSDAIERVVYNLVHNAIKFTPDNGKININTWSQRDRVFVSVADNGIGIDPGEIDMIWERFYKSDKSRGRDKSGTGLGLAIIKNLINEHGQEIWVESETGKGTQFTFTLSRAAPGKSLPEGTGQS